MKVMRNLKEGAPVTPEQWALKKSINAMFFYDEEGNEWYESQKLFSSDTIKIAFDSNNVVRCVHNDISAIYPENMSVAEIKNTTANRRADNSGRWQYIDGDIVVREYSAEELREQAQKKKNDLLSKADTAISPLERAVKLGIATAEELIALEAWERFSVLVNRVDTSKAPDIDWPEIPA